MVLDQIGYRVDFQVVDVPDVTALNLGFDVVLRQIRARQEVIFVEVIPSAIAQILECVALWLGCYTKRISKFSAPAASNNLEAVPAINDRGGACPVHVGHIILAHLRGLEALRDAVVGVGGL